MNVSMKHSAYCTETCVPAVQLRAALQHPLQQREGDGWEGRGGGAAASLEW